MSKEKTLKVIQYTLLIVVGILFAVSIANQDIIKYCVGSALLGYGLFLLIKCAYSSKNLVLTDGIVGTALIALGVSTLCSYIDLVNVLISVLSVIIAAVGSVFILDSFFKLVKKNNALFITELIVGLILLALGLMLILWSDFTQFIWVISGVLLAVYGIYAMVILLTNTKPAKRK